MFQRWIVAITIVLVISSVPRICPGQSYRPHSVSLEDRYGEVELVENPLVTVQLKDGSIFQNAKIDVDWAYMVLIVQAGNREPRNIAFDAVASIFDAQGQDITEEVLREYASPNRTQDPSIREEGSSGEVQSSPRSKKTYRYSLRRLPWKFGVTISPTYPFPFGSWYEGIKAGVGARFLASLGVSSEVAIEFGYQYQPLGFDEEFQEELDDLLGSLGSGSNSSSIKIRVDKFFFGPRYLAKARDIPLWGYGSFGLGGYRHLIEIEAVINDPNSGTRRVAERTSETKFAMTYAGGMVYMFSSNVGMDLGGRFDWVIGAAESTYSTLSSVSSGYLAELSAGLVLAF